MPDFVINMNKITTTQSLHTILHINLDQNINKAPLKYRKIVFDFRVSSDRNAKFCTAAPLPHKSMTIFVGKSETYKAANCH